MLFVATRLQASSIHGVGVFAAEPIKKGQIIWRAMRELKLDTVVARSALPSLPPEAQRIVQHYGYRSPAMPDHYIIEFDNDRFMNHSNTPNTDFTSSEIGLATQDIAQGEEITCDYREFCLKEDIGFLYKKT